MSPAPLVFRVVMQRENGRKYDGLSFRCCSRDATFGRKEMETIKGTDAVAMAETVSKTGGDFTLSFFPFSRHRKQTGKVGLKTMQHCTCRKPLPRDKFDIDGKHFFLFLDEDESPKACYRVLIRFIAFSTDGYKLKRVIWYE